MNDQNLMGETSNIDKIQNIDGEETKES